MFLVRSPVKGHAYFGFPEISPAEQPVQGQVTVSMRGLCGPIDRFGDPMKSWTQKRKIGYIVTGAPDYSGDHPCHHESVDGELVIQPFLPIPASVAGEKKGMTAANVGYSTNTIYATSYGVTEFSDLLFDGQSVVRQYPLTGTVLCYPPPLYVGQWLPRTGKCMVRAEYRNGIYLQGVGHDVSTWTLFGKPTRNVLFSLQAYKHVEGTSATFVTVVKSFSRFSDWANYFPTTADFANQGLTTHYCFWFTQERSEQSSDAVSEAALLISAKILKENFPGYVPSDPEVWHNLSQEAADQAKFTDVNTLAYVGDLRKASSLIPDIRNWRNPKTWANAYLAFKYGLSLTVQDTQALAKAIQSALTSSKDGKDRLLYSRHFAKGNIGPHEYTDLYHYKIVTRDVPDPVAQTMYGLYRWGLYPTLEGMWDMVPYSFVLDWFLDVSSLLHSIDTDIWSQYYSVLSVCRSRKIEVNLSVKTIFGSLPVTGWVKARSYHRDTPQVVDLPRAPLDSRPFHNYVEAAALIVQRIR